MDLSVIEQSPTLAALYTQLCFCYAVGDGSTQAKIIKTLTNGLERLTTSFPWLAGQVVNGGASAGDTGIFKIKHSEEVPCLIIKDHSNSSSVVTMTTLRDASFPFDMLRESDICPRMTFGGGAGDTHSGSQPVCIFQATFINGGLLFTVVVSHSAMDIVGQAQMISLLSKACRMESFTGEEVKHGNLDRRNIIPLLDVSWNPESQSTGSNKEPGSSQRSPGNSSVSSSSINLIWAYFVFKDESLTALKALATSSVTDASTFVSTDDAICALIWQSIGRARLARLDSTTDSIFTRAVNMRRLLGIPEEFLGNVINKTLKTLDLQTLVTQPLGDVASQLRSALDPYTLIYKTRASATSQSRTRDKSGSSSVDRTKYIVMSSWSKLNCYEIDFNLGLGRPESVRRPQFTPVEGIVYLLPKAPDGEIAAGLCLREDDMTKLRLDEEFVRYGRYIG